MTKLWKQGGKREIHWLTLTKEKEGKRFYVAKTKNKTPKDTHTKQHTNKNKTKRKNHQKQNQKTSNKQGENICNVYDRQSITIPNV